MTPTDALLTYQGRDARIAIGMPIKQDTGEYEWPGYIDGTLIAFYRNIPEADRALGNILAVGAFVAPDVAFAPFGWDG